MSKKNGKKTSTQNNFTLLSKICAVIFELANNLTLVEAFSSPKVENRATRYFISHLLIYLHCCKSISFVKMSDYCRLLSQLSRGSTFKFLRSRRYESYENLNPTQPCRSLLRCLLFVSWAGVTMTQNSCSAGTFRSPFDSTTCLQCPRGTYSYASSGACSLAPAGGYCISGWRFCSLCF